MQGVGRRSKRFWGSGFRVGAPGGFGDLGLGLREIIPTSLSCRSFARARVQYIAAFKTRTGLRPYVLPRVRCPAESNHDLDDSGGPEAQTAPQAPKSPKSLTLQARGPKP